MIWIEVVAFAGLCTVGRPLAHFARAYWQTSLRSTVIWAVFAWSVWVLDAFCRCSHRFTTYAATEWLGHIDLLTAVAALAPGAAVLGARRPGHTAWNFIVVTLLAVFSQPLLEQWLLRRPLETGRIGIDAPRSLFYAIVVVMAVSNYVPTRHGLAAFLAGGAILAHASAVGPWRVAQPFVWRATAAASVTAGAWLALRPGRPIGSAFEDAWGQFRDSWGMLWAQRVCERWNRMAEHYRWPVRLTWQGLRSNTDVAAESWPRDAMQRQLSILLKRFADAEWFGLPIVAPNQAREPGRIETDSRTPTP